LIRVLLADDHSLVRKGVKHVLEEASDLRVVADAADGLQAIHEFRRTHPDVVILDISMPGMDGLETVKHLCTLDRNVRILILTMYPEEQFALRVFKAGALGYITKGTSPEELHNAVRTVSRGRRFLSLGAENSLNLQILADHRSESPTDGLSNRELQVLCLIARGRRLSKIAADFGLSVKTIETYRARILQKLCLENDADICRFAFDNRLVEGTARPNN
jgi:two-component system, NarL family, invasion response regulator UvrY